MAGPPSHTERLTRLDFEHLWHPFTPMRQWRQSTPCIIERGEGFELIDTEGRRYIDGFSSLWCNVHGHRVPEIDNAVRAQLDRVAHATMLGHATEPAIEFAARLIGATDRAFGQRHGAPDAGRLNKVFYSDAGATAVEVALKMAIGRHHHRGQARRDTFVGVSGAYHGDTVGAMSIGFSPVFHDPFRAMTFRCAWAPAPDARLARGGSREWPAYDGARRRLARDTALDALDALLDQIGDRCAGVVVEPLMQGAAGMIDQPEGYLAGLAARARDRGALVIADAVATGFGRTGTMFACEEEGVRPDILCLAKGISGGYLPLAATVCTDEIAAAFEGEPRERRTLYHGHTYTGNPLACAAALASLDLFERDDILANVRRNAGSMRERLRESLRGHPHVGDVRQRGVMVGVELVAQRDPWTPFDAPERVGARVCEAARERGLLIRPLADVVVLMPAPAMDRGTLDRLLDLAVDAISRFAYPATEGRRAAAGSVH